MENFNAEGFLLVCILVAAVTHLFWYEKKCRHSESLIKKAEDGDRAALAELIRLDLEGYDGAVLVARANRRYVYASVASLKGCRHMVRCRISSFPAGRFFDLYLRELEKVGAGSARVQKVIKAVKQCRKLRRRC